MTDPDDTRDWPPSIMSQLWSLRTRPTPWVLNDGSRVYGAQSALQGSDLRPSDSYVLVRGFKHIVLVWRPREGFVGWAMADEIPVTPPVLPFKDARDYHNRTGLGLAPPQEDRV